MHEESRFYGVKCTVCNKWLNHYRHVSSIVCRCGTKFLPMHIECFLSSKISSSLRGRSSCLYECKKCGCKVNRLKLFHLLKNDCPVIEFCSKDVQPYFNFVKGVVQFFSNFKDLIEWNSEQSKILWRVRRLLSRR